MTYHFSIYSLSYSLSTFEINSMSDDLTLIHVSYYVWYQFNTPSYSLLSSLHFTLGVEHARFLFLLSCTVGWFLPLRFRSLLMYVHYDVICPSPVSHLQIRCVVSYCMVWYGIILVIALVYVINAQIQTPPHAFRKYKCKLLIILIYHSDVFSFFLLC